MSAADPVTNAIFPSEMSTTDTWESQVPYPTPITLPDSSTILAELSMYTSAINTPVPVDHTGSASSEETDDGLFRTGPSKKGMKISAQSKPIKKASGAKAPKTEYGLIEPVTPPASGKSHGRGLRAGRPTAAPQSPASQSLCTDEGDEVPSMPATPSASDSSMLPCMSKEQTALRRARRKATLKRRRGARKEEGGVVTKMEAVVCASEGDAKGASGAEPLDKKAARAIRNREAAMKSRVEAKQKMRKLQDENDELNVKVKSLSQENEELMSQLRSLLQHTLGVQVVEGQDVKEVFNAFARMTTPQ